MKSVSKDYLKYITENNFLEYSYRVEIITNGGKTTTEYDGEVIQKFEINGTESSSGFAIGNTLSMQLSLSLLLSEKTEIPTSSIVKPYIRYTWNNSSEEMCMGIFYVNSVDIDHRHKISIKASDAMSATELLGGVYTDPKVEPPVNSKFLVKDMVGKFPGQLSLNEDAIPDIEINTLMFNEHIVGKTFREILGYIAAVNGGFARVNYTEEGLSEIQFTTYKKVNGIVLTMKDDEYSKIKSIKSGKNKFRLKQIATEIYVKNEEAGVEEDKEDASAYSSVTVTSGDKDAKPHELVTFTCPIISNSLSNLSKLDRIYNLVKDVEYYPIDATLFGYHFLECGDIITIENTYGELLDLYIQDIKINVIGGVMVSVSSTYDYTKTTPLKNSVTTRVDTLTKQVETFASRFAVTDQKIDMAVSKAEVETVIQENLENLNMGVNSWIREVYNMDGAVENIEEPRAVHFQGKQAIISDIFKDPNFPLLSEFEGARTTRYATCIKVVERTTIGIMVKQVSPLQDYLPKLKNVAVYINSQERKAIPLKTIGNQPVEGTENEGYYTYNAVLNAGWNVIEVLHYEPVGSGIEVKCGGISVGDITVEDLIVNIDNLNNAHVLTESPELDLVNCNALSINYTRFVGAEFTIESDAIKQVVTEVKENTTSIGNLEVSFDKINARVESTEKNIDSLDTRYTEISNTVDEIRLASNKVQEIETKVNENESAINRIEKEAQLFVKADEIGTIVQEETSQKFNDIETNYVQKSELSQTKTDITMSFSQSGGYNLIRESAFYNDEALKEGGDWSLVYSDGTPISYIRLEYDDLHGRAYPNPNANTLFLDDLNYDTEVGLDNFVRLYPKLQQEVELVPGKTYTFSMRFSSPDSSGDWSKLESRFDFNLYYGSRLVTSSILWLSETEDNFDDGKDYISRIKSGGKVDSDWNKCKYTFTVPSSFKNLVDDENGTITSIKFTLSIDFTKVPNHSKLSIAQPLLNEGDLEIVYAPNSNEMYTGITRINKDGIKISRSNSTTSTTIDHKGMTIVTDKAVAAEFKSNEAYIPVARIGKIINSAVPSKGSQYDTLVVDSSQEESDTCFKTLQDCLNSLPDIITSTVTIEVRSHSNGGFLRDKSGSPIEIILYEGVKVGSPIILSNINNSVSIRSYSEIFSENNYPYGYVRGIACCNCHNVSISYLNLDEIPVKDSINLNSLGIGVTSYSNVSTGIILENSNAIVRCCNVLTSINTNKDGVDISCIVAARKSNCTLFNCRGNTMSSTYVKYIYLSLGYSNLYIARHKSVLTETNPDIVLDNVANVIPVNINLITFPNTEAHLTTQTNWEYEMSSDLLDAFPNEDRLPVSGAINPNYEEILEIASIVSENRSQQTRYYDNTTGHYVISERTPGGSIVGTTRKNNRYYYDRTIFEFDPNKFKVALYGAQTKILDVNGNPIDGVSTVSAKLVLTADYLKDYLRDNIHPDKYVPVTISMYSDLNHAYDDDTRSTADPLFNEGIMDKDGVRKYDYVPSNSLETNTIYLDDNDSKHTFKNHGFYPGNMTIEIPLVFNMDFLTNPLHENYRNGTEDLKSGKVRYIVVDTGIYAIDAEGNPITGKTASVKLDDAYFKMEYKVKGGYVQPGEGNGEVTPPEESEPIDKKEVPNLYNEEDPIAAYEKWCKNNGIIFKTKETSSMIYEKGTFMGTEPSPNTAIYPKETLYVIISSGKDTSTTHWGVQEQYVNDSSLFPLRQLYLYSKSQGRFIFNTSYNRKDDFDSASNYGIGYISTYYHEYGYSDDGIYMDYYESNMHGSRMSRGIFKFYKSDFISLLENADIGSIEAEFVVWDNNEGRIISNSSNEYQYLRPFKIDIHSELKTIVDNPDDITGTIVDDSGNPAITVGNSVFITDRNVDNLGIRVPIKFENNNGRRKFANGDMQYVVLDCYKFEADKGVIYKNLYEIEGLFNESRFFIDIKYTENGISKKGRIHYVQNNMRSVLTPFKIGDMLSQTCKYNPKTFLSYESGTNMSDNVSTQILNYGLEENYTFVKQTKDNRIAVDKDENGDYNFTRLVVPFDSRDFANRLPKDYVENSKNYETYVVIEFENSDDLRYPIFEGGQEYEHYRDNFYMKNVPNGHIMDQIYYNISLHSEIPSTLNPVHGKNDYVYDDNGRLSISGNNFTNRTEYYNTLSYHGNWDEYEPDCYIQKGDLYCECERMYFKYDGASDLLNGKMRYILITPAWVGYKSSLYVKDEVNDTSSFYRCLFLVNYYRMNARIKNVFLKVYAVNSTSGSQTDKNESTLKIEPWYLDEE